MPKIIHNIYEDNIGFVSKVDSSREDFNLKIVNSARISYNKRKVKFEESDEKLVKFLFSEGHTSPFRHSWYTFHLKIPLFCMRQLVKYQVGSTWRCYEIDGITCSSPQFLEAYDLMFDLDDKHTSWNEVSGRYVALKEEFYIPKKFRTNPSHGNKQKSVDLPDNFNHESYSLMMKDYYKNSYQTYKDLISAGIARELARAVLPQGIYTEAYWTVSLQAIVHFLEQRLSEDAQYEIRQVALAIKELISNDLKNIQ